jgi:phosphate:Na+ symporter
MVVGFVNAGLLDLSQSVGIIMGANIGTTITGWLVSASEWAKFLKPEMLAPIAALIGAAMILFAKKNKVKQTGEIIVGFGMLFIGISTMSAGVSPLKNSPEFASMFQTFGSNPVLGVLVGALVTAVIQSSSASVGILQSLAVTGLVSWEAAVYIIMGQNIGTCVTALLSGLGASKNARGASYIHLLFNVIGSIVFSIVAFVFFRFNATMGANDISMTEISLVHTVFNIANTVVMLPFSGFLVKIAGKLSSVRKGEVSEDEPIHLDDRILNTPNIAIENCIKEIVRLGTMAYENLQLACETVFSRNKNDIEKILEREQSIDNLTKAISAYMSKLCSTNISSEENTRITKLFHTVSDMERIGDRCEDLAEFTQLLIDEEIEFSEIAIKDLQDMFKESTKCVRNSLFALSDNDLDFAEKVIKEEEKVDILEQTMRQKHIDRLSRNECNPMGGVIFLDILSNMERASDHALNVAQTVIKNNSRAV